MKNNNIIVFCIRSYFYLQDELLKEKQFEKGLVEVKMFPDGERYQRILTPVCGRKVIILGGTISDSDTLEFYDLAFALISNGVKSISLFFLYFGYSTMERAINSGEVVTAKSRAVIFSSLPHVGHGKHFIFFDLHSEGIPHYFEGQVLISHIYCKSIVNRVAQYLAGKQFVLACTDTGRAKWVESIANEIGVNAAFIFKRRLSGDNSEVISISADVEGQDVVIYDDMIRTGGSLINAAKAYKTAGANRIFAITTHGLFSNNSLTKIMNSGIIEKVVATNSHPNSNLPNSGFYSVESLAPLIIKYLS